MFLTEKELQVRFQECLEFADKIDIATAWATSGAALEMLEKTCEQRGISLRAIVGISGNATQPEALEQLKKIGHLRLVDNNGPMFHPKVYIFRERKKSVAWIGSANFTRAGFESNEETVFETRDVKDVKSIVDWFDNRWNQCKELKPTDIDNYRKRWEEKPPSRDMERIVNSPPPQSGTWLSLDSDLFKGADRANPFPTKIRFQEQDIGYEWTEERGHQAWGKMFVCLADWLAREGRMTKDDCPVEIIGNGPGRKPFLCVATDRSQLPKRECHEISDGLWVAVPKKNHHWRAKRAKQLLEKFHIDLNDIELRMSGCFTRLNRHLRHP